MEKPIKHYSCGFVLKGDKILLGKKMRGFGVGKWNGFGGKVEPDEEVDAALAREFNEECGIVLTNFEKFATIKFVIDTLEHDMICHMYQVHSYEGEPVATDEMQPQWFDVKDIPFKSMWADDPLWFPLFLAGQKFDAHFHFANDDIIRSYRITIQE